MAKEHKKFASAPHLMILLSILLLSMGFLGWLLHTLHDRHQQRLHEHFLTDVGHLTATIDWYMDAYTQILHGAAGLFLADGKVSRENWQSYVEHGVVCGRGRNPTLRLWPAIFSGEIDVFPSERRNMGQEIGR